MNVQDDLWRAGSLDITLSHVSINQEIILITETVPLYRNILVEDEQSILSYIIRYIKVS